MEHRVNTQKLIMALFAAGVLSTASAEVKNVALVHEEISLGDSTSLDQPILWYGSIRSSNGSVVMPVG